MANELKVKVSFRPVGSTPKLKNPVLLVQSAYKFAALAKFVRRQLNYADDQSLFCYINASFAPSLDTEVGELHQMYSVDGVLNVSYCNTVAFG